MESNQSPPVDSTMSDPPLPPPHQQPSAWRRALKFNLPMTPEEHVANSFSTDVNDDKMPKLAPITSLVSPPTSPAFSTLPNLASATGFPSGSPQYARSNAAASEGGRISPNHSQAQAFGEAAFKDAPLFPVDTRGPRHESPLFGGNDRHHHITPPQPPVVQRRRSVQGFTLDYPFNLGISTSEQAYQFWQDRCAEIEQYRTYELPVPRRSASPRDPISASQLQSVERSSTPVSRAARITTTAPRAPRVAKSSPPQPKAMSTSPRAPRRRTQGEFVASAFPSKDEKVTKHKRAPASKPRPTGENWHDVPDYCPPLSSLDSSSRSLKVRTVGNSGPLDLSNDPDRDQLHPDELHLASLLRLQCAKYLLNKRKIFKAKVEHLRSSPTTNFNKTEAQKACTIDVNKASSLYAAFEDAGWFRRDWFEQYV